MKGFAFAALALGAFAAVNAEDENVTLTNIRAMFDADQGSINWETFNPDSLGMDLNFDEMSGKQLREVAKAFAKLGLIAKEEQEDLALVLTDARMRHLITSVKENWPQTMQDVVEDPRYAHFLTKFQNGFDTEALATIVGLKGEISAQMKELTSGKTDKQ